MIGAESLIDRAYECALLPELWESFLADVSLIVGAEGGILFTSNSDTGIASWKASEGVRDATEDFISEGWLFKGLRLSRVISLGNHRFVTESDILTETELAKDPLYAEFLRPKGFGWAAGTSVRLSNDDSLVVSFERSLHAGPADQNILHILDGLRPHLVRSAALGLRMEEKRSQTIGDTLSLIGLTGLVVDTSGRVLAASTQSASLDSLLSWRSGDRFALRDPNAASLLKTALAGLHRNDAGEVRSFVARRPERSSMVVHVVPIRGRATDFFRRASAILMFIPVSVKAPPAVLIQSLFDLTAAEARVAGGLAVGQSLDQIAAAGSVAIGTVRSQAKSILAKMGCHRQSEVTAILGTVRQV